MQRYLNTNAKANLVWTNIAYNLSISYNVHVISFTNKPIHNLGINPRPTKPFCNTVYQRGGYHPHVNLKLKPLETCNWYHSIARDLLFSYIPK